MDSESISQQIRRMSARRNFLKSASILALSFLAACLGKDRQLTDQASPVLEPEKPPLDSATPEGLKIELELSTPAQEMENVSAATPTSLPPLQPLLKHPLPLLQPLLQRLSLPACKAWSAPPPM